MPARFVLAVVLVLGFLNTPSNGNTDTYQSSGCDSAVRFKLRDNYKVMVPVSVNGLEPMDFILDTGTKTTMIDECICRKLELKMVARMPLTTFTGTRIVTISQLAGLSMGTVSVQGLEVSCLDLRGAFSTDSDVRGVLGQNFLSRFNYLLDYQRRAIALEAAGDLQRDLLGERLPLELRDYRDHVHCKPGFSSEQEIHFMLDSGAPFTVVFENRQVFATLQVQRDSSSRPSENRPIERGHIPILRIGSESMGKLTVIITQAQDIERRWENGLLPTRLFKAIYFNHEAGYIILNPRPAVGASLNR